MRMRLRRGLRLRAAGSNRVAPPVLLHRRDQLAAARGHDRGARGPIRVAVKLEGHGLIFPLDDAGILVDLDHAEAIIGLRLLARGRVVRRTVRVALRVFAIIRENAPWKVRIAGRKVNTAPVGRERVPHPAPEATVAGGVAGSEELEPSPQMPVGVDSDDPPLPYRIVAGVVDRHIDCIA